MASTPSIEILLSKYFKPEAERVLKEHPELINQVLPICLTNEAPMCWRAAWVARTVIEENDARVRPTSIKYLMYYLKKRMVINAN